MSVVSPSEFWDANGCLESVVYDMAPSLADVPLEVFTESILPFIGVKEVGALAMMCKSLRGICDDNSVWKTLYLRTIRANIIDTSVHIGSKAAQRRRGAPADGPKGVDPCIYRPQWWFGNPRASTEINASLYLQCLPCIPGPVLDSPALQDWNLPITITDNHNHHHDRATTQENRKALSETLRTEWQDHNRALGCSTVNLCQNTSHYIFDTLELPQTCRNLKSYKNAVLKKLLTSEKQPLKSLSKKLTSKAVEVAKVRALLDALQADELAISQEIERRRRTMDKLSNATQSTGKLTQ